VILSPAQGLKFFEEHLENPAIALRHAFFDCTLTARDVPGINCYGVIPSFADQPVLAEGEARFTSAMTAGGPADHLAALLHERSPLAFFDLNFVKGEAFYSPAFKKLLGYADQAIAAIYDAFLALLHPDDSAAAPDKQGRGGSPGWNSDRSSASRVMRSQAASTAATAPRRRTNSSSG